MNLVKEKKDKLYIKTKLTRFPYGEPKTLVRIKFLTVLLINRKRVSQKWQYVSLASEIKFFVGVYKKRKSKPTKKKDVLFFVLFFFLIFFIFCLKNIGRMISA